MDSNSAAKADYIPDQRLLDLTWNWLEAQGRPSLGAPGEGREDAWRQHAPCAYRSPDGARCGIGALLGGWYREAMEGYDVGNLAHLEAEAMVAAGLIRPGPTDDDRLLLLEKIQFCHDRAVVVPERDDFVESLRLNYRSLLMSRSGIGLLDPWRAGSASG